MGLIIGDWPAPPETVTRDWIESLGHACDGGKARALRLLAGRSLPWAEALDEAEQLLTDDVSWLKLEVGIDGSGSGYGDGYGSGSGSGSGYGDGYGSGYGYGDGYGSGYGSGVDPSTHQIIATQ